MKPKQGDVIFTRSKIQAALGSCLAQYCLDDAVTLGSGKFSHVSMVIDDSFVLEAVSEDAEDATGKATGVPLPFGVRIKPLPDVLHPETWSKLVVLRHPKFGEMAATALGPSNLIIPGMMGSEYSLQKLKDSADTWVLKPIKWLADSTGLFEWSSTPEDVFTKMKIDAEFREKVKASFAPRLLDGLAAKTYFCSELVVDLLNIAGVFEGDYGNKISTPSGLFAQLKMNPTWIDVTDEYRTNPDLASLSPDRIASWKNHHTFNVGFYNFMKQQIALGLTIKALQAAIDTMNAKSVAIIEKYSVAARQ